MLTLCPFSCFCPLLNTECIGWICPQITEYWDTIMIEQPRNRHNPENTGFIFGSSNQKSLLVFFSVVNRVRFFFSTVETHCVKQEYFRHYIHRKKEWVSICLRLGTGRVWERISIVFACLLPLLLLETDPNIYENRQRQYVMQTGSKYLLPLTLIYMQFCEY